MSSDDLTFRPGSFDDLDAVLGLFDEAVAWMVSDGRAAQWGSEPWSTDERRSGFVRNLLSNESATIVVAELGGRVIGVTIFGPEHMPYTPDVDEPEIYLTLLLASPKVRGMGIGSKLVDLVKGETMRRGIDLLRVDCWSGGDFKLVTYYEGLGFVPTERVEVRENTFLQVFEMRLGTSRPNWTDSIPDADVQLSFHHLQLAIPPGSEEANRRFWVEIVGMTEVTKPQSLQVLGGLWVKSGSLEIHLGLEDPFRPAKKAHPGIRVGDLKGLATRFEANDVAVNWDTRLPGYERFYVADPNGNRLEFLRPTDQA